MSYSIKVSRDETPELFKAFEKFIIHLGSICGSNYKKELIEIMKTEYNIKIQEHVYCEKTHVNYHPVEFANEQDFLLFLLKWT